MALNVTAIPLQVLLYTVLHGTCYSFPSLSFSPDLQVDFSVVWQVSVYLTRSWPSQTVTWTNRTEELQQDMEFPFCFHFVSPFLLENSSLCMCWSNGEYFSWQQTRRSLHKHYMTAVKIIKALAVLNALTEDALFFLFSLWLSSSKPLKMIHFKGSTLS